MLVRSHSLSPNGRLSWLDPGHAWLSVNLKPGPFHRVALNEIPEC